MLKFFAPKYYLTWLALFGFWLLSHLPFSIQRLLSYVFGFVLYYLLSKRRYIAKTNIDLCFPKKTPQARKTLLKAHFNTLGMSIVATANSFYLSTKRTRQVCVIKGGEYLAQAKANNQAIILLTGHFTPMMFANAMITKCGEIAAIFRPQDNQLFDQAMRQNLTKKGMKMVSSKDTKNIIRTLNSKIPVWYAHDQDLGKDKSVFAPFFGIDTATITATAKLAKISNAVVLPVLLYCDKHRYVFEFSPALSHYPSDNELADATVTNAVLEAQINQVPAQYFWIHKRFKTRPSGQKSFY